MGMLLQKFIFYFFSAQILGSALMVILSRNTVRSAFFLIVTFFASAVLWISLEAEFLGLLLIFVYVGAVMTLFMFVVMMLNVEIEVSKENFVRYLPLAVIVVAGMIGILIFAVSPEHLGLLEKVPPEAKAADYSNIKALGLVLYTDYFYVFELAAVILLIAIVAAIGLTHRVRGVNKTQNISKQLLAKKEGRLRIVTMASEKPQEN